VSIETAVCALSSVDILRLLTTLALSPFVNVSFPEIWCYAIARMEKKDAKDGKK
jgi:hypothetical protein